MTRSFDDLISKALRLGVDQIAYPVDVLLDLGRQKVLSSAVLELFLELHGELQQVGMHRVAPPSELVKRIHGTCQFVGNGARFYRDMFDAALGSLSRFSHSCQDTIQAGTIARLALKQFKENETQGLHATVPYYIRRSDAEVNAGNLQRSRPPSS